MITSVFETIESEIIESKRESNEPKNKYELLRDKFLERTLAILEEDSDRRELMRFCDQSSVLSFDAVFDQRSYRDFFRLDCGSYAQLFIGFDIEAQREVVFKVSPVMSHQLKNRIEALDFLSLATFDEIINEFQISQALSHLRNTEIFQTRCFPQVYGKFLVSGDIPQYLLTDSPSKEPLDPMKDIFRYCISKEYAILVMSFGGNPLWRAIDEKTISGRQLLSVVCQVTIGLAIAEAAVEFEHRDLHISNILIRDTNDKQIDFIHRFNRYSVNSEGIEATIIDTTFSRIKYMNRIYRKNLTKIMTFDRRRELSALDKCYQQMVELTENDWNRFVPKTNTEWLAYICKALYNCSVVKNCKDSKIRQSIKQLYKLFKIKDNLQEIDFDIVCNISMNCE